MSAVPSTLSPEAVTGAHVSSIQRRVRGLRCPHCGKLVQGDPPTVRVCKCCGLTKPVSEMIKARKNAFGIGHICKRCLNISRRDAEREKARRDRETLSDTYIRDRLVGHDRQLRMKDFPPDVIALKRAQLKLARSLKG